MEILSIAEIREKSSYIVKTRRKGSIFSGTTISENIMMVGWRKDGDQTIWFMRWLDDGESVGLDISSLIHWMLNHEVVEYDTICNTVKYRIDRDGSVGGK